MNKQYLAPRLGITGEIAQCLKITIRTVNNALTFRSNSDLAKRARVLAREKGCRLIYDGFVPDCELNLLRDEDGKLTSVFTFAEQVTVTLIDTHATLAIAGKTAAEYASVTTRNLIYVLKYAQRLSEERREK